MTKPILAAVLATALLAPTASHAVETSLQIQLGAQSDFERRTMVYDCATEAPVTVTYINAAPNFLALVPIAEQPEPLIFVSLISGSGVRYASGQWIWWSKGAEASLYDATLGEDAEPVLACSEVNNTP
ncbi:MliC family protein [Devosia sp. Root635]|uniref:MliC family protein n=1 Tax=Devosia sp. Root635 TaxID=1736575 RepID=UPI0007017AB6|nr:MliC family protein [Devosia sp. Root635]KRA40273.1 hypothetical protein ASD80_12770 [Devosia sp. Root635]